MATWVITFSPGGTVTALVEVPSIYRNRRLFTELKPNVNRLEFRMLYDATLFATLIASDVVTVTVTKDGAAYFTGVLSPNYRAQLRNGRKWINMIAEDNTLEKLGRTISSITSYAGYAVCTPSATATSLVHAIATAAGVTLAAGLPTISTVVPYVVVLPEDNLTWGQLLEDILFEFNYVYNYLEDNTLTLVQAVNTGTVTTTGTLTTAAGSVNIRGEPIVEKSPEKYDDIRVNYNLVEAKTGIILFQDTTGGDETTEASIPLAATGDADGKDYYPLTSKDGEVFSAWNSPEGFEIWVATSAALDADVESGISVSRALTNYYRKCSFAYQNTAAAEKLITKLRILGNAYVISSKNTVRTGSGRLRLEREAHYLFADATARSFGQALYQYYKYSDLKIEAKSATAYTLGQYVLFADAVYAGISVKCRVIGIEERENKPGVYQYSLEAVEDFSAVTLTTEGASVPPPATVPEWIALEAAAAVPSIYGLAMSFSRCDLTGEPTPRILDNSGNGNHGTLNGGVTAVMGEKGVEFNLDDVDDWVDLTPVTLPSFSFLFWYKGTDPGYSDSGLGRVSMFISRSASTTIIASLNLLDNGKPRFRWADAGGVSTMLSPNIVINDDVNHFIMIQHDGTKARIIVDDEVESKNDATTLTANACVAMALARYYASTVNILGGRISEPKLYTRYLTRQEYRGAMRGEWPEDIAYQSADWKLGSIADDDVVSAEERPRVLDLWSPINGNGSTTGSYWTTCARAIALSLTGSTEYTTLVAKRDAYYDYLYVSPNILGSTDPYVAIVKADWAARQAEYYSAESAMLSKIAEEEAALAEAAAESYADGAAAAAQSAAQSYADGLASALEGEIDERVRVFCQAAEPGAGMEEGDLWVDSDDGNNLYRYSGTAWVDIQDTAISEAYNLADGKNTVFATLAAAQASGVSGDLFLDSGLLYRATVDDASITIANSTRCTPKRYADVADDAARAALTGMIVNDTVYQLDTNQWYYYSGAAWVADGDPVLTTSDVDARVTATTPHYLGRYAYASAPGSANTDDTCVLYSATAGQCGIYKWGGSWAKQTTPTTEMIGAAWADICKAVVDGYNAVTDYIGSGVNFMDVLAVNAAFIAKLLTQKLTVDAGTGSKVIIDPNDEEILSAYSSTDALLRIFRATSGDFGDGDVVMGKLTGSSDTTNPGIWFDKSAALLKLLNLLVKNSQYRSAEGKLGINQTITPADNPTEGFILGTRDIDAAPQIGDMRLCMKHNTFAGSDWPALEWWYCTDDDPATWARRVYINYIPAVDKLTIHLSEYSTGTPTAFLELTPTYFKINNVPLIMEHSAKVSYKLHGNTTSENIIFDTFVDCFAATNDERLIWGYISKSGKYLAVSFMVKTSSTQITFYGGAQDGTVDSVVVDDGGSDTYAVSLAC